MKFTGERFLPAEQGKIRLEHYHRYAIVLNFISGKDVLDIACGEGYGSSLMADIAQSVVGVDISDEAVLHASSSYIKSNLKFQQGSATQIDLPSSSFDVIVSFETIEHLLEQEKMLSEFRRVLKQDGILIISSPNRPIYSEESGEHNEFHVKELDFNEFNQLLKSQFPSIGYYGQRMMMGSMIKPFTGEAPTFDACHDNGDKLLHGTGNPLQDPVYFLAICAISENNLPSFKPSVLYPDDLDLVKYYTGFAKWAQNLETEKNSIIDHLTPENEHLRQENEHLRQENEHLRQEINAIKQSKSWQITRPLRKLQTWFSRLKHKSKLILLGLPRIAKRFYQLLPISNITKTKQKRLLAKYFPRVLRTSSPHYFFSTPLAIPMTAKQKHTNTDLESVARSITLRTDLQPTVSIIIPIYGKCNYTLGCLASIADNTPSITFEIIVVDDCSPDQSLELIQSINGIRIISNQQNQGFIRSCNIGANAANGEFLYFLNNDTEVTSGWLDELVQTFENFPGTGLVGSKLLYPDGKLQEAGGIIWQDGSAWNFGRLQDPMDPSYNYAREVDYCSGASIIIPSKLFNELGGFDEHYLPAYCEDSDLALKIRNKGYRVIYQPLSIIFHFEGITSGTDTTQGIKAFQIENTKKLYERWENRLRNHQAAGKDIENAKDRRATRRVLVIDHCTPTPNQDAGSVTVYNLMLLLREMDFQVTFAAEDNLLYLPEYTTELQHNGIEVLYTPYTASVEKHLQKCGNRYDLAFLFRPTVVDHYLKSIRKYCTNAKVLYHTVDLHHLRMSREAKLQSDKTKQKTADEMKQRELASIGASDASIVHSTKEFELIRPELPETKLHVFPLIMNIGKTSTAFPNRKDIAFVGSYQHPPNIDAVQHFVSDIMPLLRTQLPGVRFYAVGSHPPAEIQALASKDVIITGFIEDLSGLLDKMRISVAPLRYGAGIKGKIGSAMTIGLPVVGTPLAVEGMSLTDGENILVAEGVEQFVKAIKDIYLDEILWNRISQNGIEFADKTWGAEAGWKILQSILIDLDFNIERGTYPLTLYSETAVRKGKGNRQSTQLNPIASVNCYEEFDSVIKGSALEQIRQSEDALIKLSNTKYFSVNGFCIPCNKESSFAVDMQSGGQDSEGTWKPNWRERLECTQCHMNNRQRLIAAIVKQDLDSPIKKNVYLMEQITPIYDWVTRTFNNHNIVGSEYLGYEYESGSIVKGIRHEDIENLSFTDSSLDFIISNDVFEHIPNPQKAFTECARSLKNGGLMLVTIPFHSANDRSISRAIVTNGQVEHLQPPLYHGNPVSSKGSLVFTDFGWDILDVMRQSGFTDVCIDIYASTQYAHLGGGQTVFRLIK